MQVKIYHNPKCSKSRKALELLVENNIEHEVIEYKVKGLILDEVKSLSDLLGKAIKEFIRTKDEEYKLINIDWDNPELAAVALVKHPSLLERPLIVANNKAIIARPPEKLLEFLGI